MAVLPGDLLIRADASPEIGAGHVVRCLALAHAWQHAGGHAHFITARPHADLRRVMDRAGVGVTVLDRAHPDPLDLDVTSAEVSRRRRPAVILDGYHFDGNYQQTVKALDCRLGVMDDLADIPRYHADVIINQNLHAPALTYRATPETTYLLGPRFALLRPEFLALKEWVRSIPDNAQNILITFGGSDARGASLLALEALASLSSANTRARVIAGALNPRIGELRTIAKRATNVEVLIDVPNMPEQMQWADLAVCAGGSTTWELAFMGVPMILVTIADNQVPGARALDAAGLGSYLGPAEDLTALALRGALNSLIPDAAKRRTMSQKGRECVDGLGADRVVRALRQDVRVRRAVESDCRVLWEWANEPDVRAQSFSSEPIPWERHVRWFEVRLQDAKCVLFIGEDMSGTPIGQVRFDIAQERATISVSLSATSRGRGLGPVLIKRTGEALGNLAPVEFIDAYVKPDNLASVRAFEKAGYTLAGTTDIRGQQALRFTWTRG